MQNYELLIKKNADVDVPDYSHCYDDDEVGNHIRYFVSVQDDDIDTFENWAMKNDDIIDFCVI